MPNTPITISGNLTKAPTLRRTTSGAAVLRARVASDRRIPGSSEDVWVSTDQLFIDVEAWGELARNAKVSLGKGMPVVVTGYLVTQEWQQEGKERQSKVVLKARSIAVDLNRHVVQAARVGAQNEEHGGGVGEVLARRAVPAQLYDDDQYEPPQHGNGGEANAANLDGSFIPEDASVPREFAVPLAS